MDAFMYFLETATPSKLDQMIEKLKALKPVDFKELIGSLERYKEFLRRNA